MITPQSNAWIRDAVAYLNKARILVMIRLVLIYAVVFFSGECLPNAEFWKGCPGPACPADEASNNAYTYRKLLREHVDPHTGKKNLSASRTCQYTYGPKSGTVEYFPPNVDEAPIGAPCQDGMGSSGIAIPDSQNARFQQSPEDLGNRIKESIGVDRDMDGKTINDSSPSDLDHRM
jgi:hypothetical protein